MGNSLTDGLADRGSLPRGASQLRCDAAPA
jgi:hypothetical protein